MTILRAKAKVNLFFHIIGKRSDGYHEIESLVIFTQDIFDEIEILPSKSINTTKVTGGEFSSSILHEKNNLITKALDLFSDNNHYQCNLIKNIPVGAGLGGGSADAAEVLKFLEQPITNENLAKLGADVPVCYYNQPTYCTGIGEILTVIENMPTLYIVLVNPRIELLTKDVFRKNTKIDYPVLNTKPTSFENAEELLSFLKNTTNVLTDAAKLLVPEIDMILNFIMSQNACEIARMSGSGPTCFGIFKNYQDAMNAQLNIQQKFPGFWVKTSRI